MTEAPAFSAVFAALASESGLDATLTRRVFDAILAGSWTPAQIGAFLIALRLRGETAPIIAAAAESLRAAMFVVDHGLPLVLDTCGTGGDGSGSLNLSTGAAIIAAAAGVPVAKHGNRAVSSRSGSADVLEALGVPLDVPPAAAQELLREVGVAFLMAPAHHPALRHAGAVRRELGVRTIFNCLGPLANPARATHQLLGAYDDRLRALLADTLRTLGSERAWVVRGEDGLDEMSPHAATLVTELSDGALRELSLTPEDFGLPRLARSATAGGDAAENARALEQVLNGAAHPARDAFVLNAAAALVVARRLALREATALAQRTIDSGAARAKLDAWRSAARSRSSGGEP